MHLAFVKSPSPALQDRDMVWQQYSFPALDERRVQCSRLIHGNPHVDASLITLSNTPVELVRLPFEHHFFIAAALARLG